MSMRRQTLAALVLVAIALLGAWASPALAWRGIASLLAQPGAQQQQDTVTPAPAPPPVAAPQPSQPAQPPTPDITATYCLPSGPL